MNRNSIIKVDFKPPVDPGVFAAKKSESSEEIKLPDEADISDDENKINQSMLKN